MKKEKQNFKEAFPESAKILEKQQTIEQTLNHIGIVQSDTRADTYNRWKRFLEFIRDNSGKSWREEVRPKLRSWLGIGFRYIDEYFNACLTWKIIELHNGIINFKGVSDNEKEIQ